MVEAVSLNCKPDHTFIVEDIDFSGSCFECGDEIVPSNTGRPRLHEERDADGNIATTLVCAHDEGCVTNPATG